MGDANAAPGCDDTPGFSHLPEIHPLLYVGNKRSAAWAVEQGQPFDFVLSTVPPRGLQGEKVDHLSTVSLFFQDGNGRETQQEAVLAADLILQGAVIVGKALAEGKRTLVHCAWGQNRSCAMCCVYAVLQKGWTPAHSIQYIRDRNLVDRRCSGQVGGPMNNGVFCQIVVNLYQAKRTRPQHAVVVLGCGKPSTQGRDWSFEDTNLHKRAEAGVRTLLSLLVQGKDAQLLLSGGFDEAKHMARWARRRLDESGIPPEEASKLVKVESESKTTLQNATCCKKMEVFGRALDSVLGLHVWLVSGLTHLPRASMLFEAELPLARVVAVPAYGVELTTETYRYHRPEHIREEADGNEQTRANGNFPVTLHSKARALAFADSLLWGGSRPAVFSRVLTVWRKHAECGLHLDGPASVATMTYASCSGQSETVCVHRVRFGPVRPEWECAQWAFVPCGDGEWNWLVNRWYPHLRVHTEFGAVVAMEGVPDGWSSAKWKTVPAGNGVHRIVNKWRGGRLALHVENVDHATDGSFGLVECGTVQENWSSAKWVWL